MEIKHTIEILTKDIQDIEKLVGNLQNSQEGTAIELDLAMSKLRNVYEILTLIKADHLKGLLQAAPEVKPEPVAAAEPEPMAAAEPEPVATAEPEPMAAAEPEPVAAAEPEPVPESDSEPVPEPVITPKKQKEAGILAEKFASESSINENFGGQREQDADSKLLGTPIEQISRNIGINDRFLIIRELFEGNSEEFAKLINALDDAGNYHTAMELLNAHFADTLDHSGVEILAGLVKRRFSPA